jgi:hypothetical protein
MSKDMTMRTKTLGPITQIIIHTEVNCNREFFTTEIYHYKLYVVVHVSNPSTREAEAGGSQLEATLCYIVTPCL